MTTDEKLAAILAAIQVDPGNRDLAELFRYCPDDFAAACRRVLSQPRKELAVLTGFFIPSASPPAFETDGPLGAAFLVRALTPLGYGVEVLGESPVKKACDRVARGSPQDMSGSRVQPRALLIAIERSGPAADGRCRTMRGVDVTPHVEEWNELFHLVHAEIGIGDGGNEIGMGKIPHEIVARDIPNGDLIHCRLPADYLIVAGVSNWGAYALAAGIYVLRGATPPPDLFDPDREREILEVMVKEGPLVDGVTGKQTATVDGLSWDEYVKPLIRIRDILGARSASKG
jgi:hypothetical protein